MELLRLRAPLARVEQLAGFIATRPGVVLDCADADTVSFPDAEKSSIGLGARRHQSNPTFCTLKSPSISKLLPGALDGLTSRCTSMSESGRTDTPDDKARAAGLSLKAMMRADPAAGSITLDSETTLRGIPPEAWTYKLGNRSALEWVLDQYKEKKPTDPTIAEKFNTYRFADYKEQVIDLLKRVCTVSVETIKIVKQMELAT